MFLQQLICNCFRISPKLTRAFLRGQNYYPDFQFFIWVPVFCTKSKVNYHLHQDQCDKAKRSGVLKTQSRDSFNFITISALTNAMQWNFSINFLSLSQHSGKFFSNTMAREVFRTNICERSRNICAVDPTKKPDCGFKKTQKALCRSKSGRPDVKMIATRKRRRPVAGGDLLITAASSFSSLNHYPTSQIWYDLSQIFVTKASQVDAPER